MPHSAKAKAVHRKGKAKGQKKKPSIARQPSYILSIPDDVLFEILMALGLPDSMDREMANNLTSVCRRWRIFVMDTPLFWTKILEIFDSWPKTLNPYERSKPALLDVDMDARYATDEGFKRTCGHIAKHLARFRQLTVHVEVGRDAQMLLKKWEGCEMPCLQSMRVEVSYGVSPLPSLPLGIVSLQSLRSLTLSGCFNLNEHISPILTLECLDIIAPVPPTLTMFKFILRNFPQLETLILRHNEDTLGEIFYRNEVEMADEYPESKLRSLAMSLPSMRYDCSFISQIAKDLHYLEVVPQGYGRGDMKHSVMRQLKLFPSLKKLRLNFVNDACPFIDDTFVLSDLPEGIKLEIDHPPCMFENTLADILNLPKLKAITIFLATSGTSSVYLDSIGLSKNVCKTKPELSCPTTLLLPEGVKLDSKAIDILGAHLTVVNLAEGRLTRGLIPEDGIDLQSLWADLSEGDYSDGYDYGDYWSGEDYYSDDYEPEIFYEGHDSDDIDMMYDEFM